jgi:3-hydroxyisobutyrate dehydrogenase-like beta-hydroxyacid dehydrogenase
MISAEKLRVGFIGLGSQGGPMAQRIIDAGFEVTLWARREESLKPFDNSGAKFAETPEALAKQCNLVCVCVIDDAGVQELCGLLLPVLSPGSLLVIHSTIHPKSCVALAQQAKQYGIAVIDAPVSGGGPAAESGTLTVMVGGSEAHVTRARPVLNCFAGLVTHVGDVGTGQTAKLINNNLMAANLALAHAAVELGTILQLDRIELLKLIGQSSGRSFAFDVYARMPSPAAFAHGAALLKKDIRLLGELIGSDDKYFQQLGDVGSTFIDAVENDSST